MHECLTETHINLKFMWTFIRVMVFDKLISSLTFNAVLQTKQKQYDLFSLLFILLFYVNIKAKCSYFELKVLLLKRLPSLMRFKTGLKPYVHYCNL